MTGTDASFSPGAKLLHAYIISGGTSESRETYARRIAAAAVCSSSATPCGTCSHCRKAQKGIHPDISVVEKHSDKTELTIDIMRSVRADAFVLPNEAERKVYIIRGADEMNAEAQNAMLKVFEEPPKFVVFLLLAENPQRLLPTVRSRCALVTLSGEEDGGDLEDAQVLVRTYADGNSLAAAEVIMKLEKLEKPDFERIFPQIKKAAVTQIRAGGDSEKLMKLISAVEEAQAYLAVNVGKVHIVGMLMSRLV